MTTLATTTIFVGPMLSPQPPAPNVRRSLELVDWEVFLLEENVDDPNAEVKPTRLGHVGAGWTVDKVPSELRKAYDRLTYLYEDEIAEMREAQRARDDERAEWAHGFDMTRGL
jgi:hypothetical protein